MANSNEQVMNKQEASIGTGLLVIKSLQPYIHCIKTMHSTVLAMDFFFLKNQKIRIISIYLSSANKELNKQTQQKVSKWVQQAITKNYETIVMRDFNFNRNKNSKYMILLIKEIEQMGWLAYYNTIT